jgi:hypothetical protein
MGRAFGYGDRLGYAEEMFFSLLAHMEFPVDYGIAHVFRVVTGHSGKE